MRVVLDTNILISALITSVSPSAQVLALWRGRRFDLLTCAEQLEEFARATRYLHVRARLLPAVAGALLNRVLDRAMVLETLHKPACGISDILLHGQPESGIIEGLEVSHWMSPTKRDTV